MSICLCIHLSGSLRAHQSPLHSLLSFSPSFFFLSLSLPYLSSVYLPHRYLSFLCLFIYQSLSLSPSTSISVLRIWRYFPGSFRHYYLRGPIQILSLPLFSGFFSTAETVDIISSARRDGRETVTLFIGQLKVRLAIEGK